MNTIDSQPSIEITDDIKQYIEDGNHLISYIAKAGQVNLSVQLTSAMVEAKFKAAVGRWTEQDEVNFLLNFDQLAEQVYPITVASIKAVTPALEGKSKGKSQALSAVIWYRRATFFSLAFLLLAQLYWIIGNNLRVNLSNIFAERETIHATINQPGANNQQPDQLQENLALANQKLDANYELLKIWNRISAFGNSFEGTLPQYTQEKLEFERIQAGNKQSATDKDNGQALTAAHLNEDLYKARIMYFKNILAADFFLDSFQGYFLPLLYGLLGAFIYVLRCLNRDIRALVYTPESEINYRLRLTLGALGGMIVGWFLKPQAVDTIASLSPMALAFLMGYNVDVLFSVMDRAIDNIRSAIDKPAASTPPPATPATPAQDKQ